MADLISRAAAIKAAFKGADDWDGGFNPKYLNELPAVDAVPIADAKAIAEIALYTISKMEDFGCAYVWEKSGDPDGDENNIRAECKEYRRKIKAIMEVWNDADLP